MPRQALHDAGLVLTGRSYRPIRGGPYLWIARNGRRTNQASAGGWSGHFVLDAAPDAVFDITEWIDRDHPQQPMRRYSYQVRYCNGHRRGVLWQYRLDHHPLSSRAVFVSHHHDQAATEDEHAPIPGAPFLTLAEALPLLEQHLFLRVGPCTEGTPGFRGRAPHLPPKGAPVIEP